MQVKNEFINFWQGPHLWNVLELHFKIVLEISSLHLCMTNWVIKTLMYCTLHCLWHTDTAIRTSGWKLAFVHAHFHVKRTFYKSQLVHEFSHIKLKLCTHFTNEAPVVLGCRMDQTMHFQMYTKLFAFILKCMEAMAWDSTDK